MNLAQLSGYSGDCVVYNTGLWWFPVLAFCNFSSWEGMFLQKVPPPAFCCREEPGRGKVMEQYLKRLFFLVLCVAFLGGCGETMGSQGGTEAGTETDSVVSGAWTDPDDITFDNAANLFVEYVAVSHGADEAIHFSDPGMEARVRLWADKPEGDLYRSDVWDIHFLFIGAMVEGEVNRFLTQPLEGTGFRVVDDYIKAEEVQVGAEVPEVRSLCDLAYFESLQVLTIDTDYLGWIVDITGLEKCENLSVFRLFGNAPEHLEVIAEMKNLEFLALDSVKDMDLTLVQGLEKLEMLYFYDSSFPSLEPVAGMPLKVFKISCGINTRDLVDVDFAPLAHLTELRRLDLCSVDSFTLEDVAYLKGLKHLKMLDLIGAKLEEEVDAVRRELPGVSVRVMP